MGGHQIRQALRSLLQHLQRLRRMETRRNNNSNNSKLNKTSTNNEDLQINNNLYIIVHFNKTTSPCFYIFIFQFEAEKQSFSVSEFRKKSALLISRSHASNVALYIIRAIIINHIVTEQTKVYNYKYEYIYNVTCKPRCNYNRSHRGRFVIA